VIPKPLDQIEWADLEALKDNGREESDTIEYKASFSGGSDYLNFNDNQRDKAIRGIAREVIAFLNGRGGDIIIGAEEEDNENARIKAFKLIPGVSLVADRLAQSLSAVIEPYQSIIGVRAIRNGVANEGVIVVRAQQSLRAPHRLTKDKECYIRRGRESVPMPMDEIQDVTVQRRRNLQSHLQTLSRQFDNMRVGKVRRHQLWLERFHVRIAFVPIVMTQIELNDAFLHSLEIKMPQFFVSESALPFDSPFTYISSVWRHTLRGRFQDYSENILNGHRDMLVSREILQSGVSIFDFAIRIASPSQHSSEVHSAAPAEWTIRFFGHSLAMINQIAKEFPQLKSGLLSIAFVSTGSMNLVWNGNMGRDPLDEGFVQTEHFEVVDESDIGEIFTQMQWDLYSQIERKPPAIWSMKLTK
jgi:Putative DNA-binding domain